MNTGSEHQGIKIKSRDIFIAYSHLASDLGTQVAGVWIHQSTIQPRQKWHDEIIEPCSKRSL